MNIEQDIDFELARLRQIALRMDALFYIPRTRISIGMDNILGLVPVIGDVAASLPSLWMIQKARHLGASPGTLAYMFMNTLADFLIGLIPFFGDIFDMLYNANIRNYNALEANVHRNAARAKTVRTAQNGIAADQKALLA